MFLKSLGENSEEVRVRIKSTPFLLFLANPP